MKLLFLPFLITASLLANPSQALEQTKANVIKELRAFKPESTQKVLKGQSRGEKLHYIKISRKGFIRLDQGQWIYFIPVTQKGQKHGEEGLTLAIDQNGTLYENHAHVCADTVRFGSTQKLPDTSKAFFNAYKDIETNRPWQPTLP